MRRLSTAVVAAALLIGAAWSAAPAATAAGRTDASPRTSADVPMVAIVKVSGLIDPVLADFLTRSVHQAEAQGAIGMVLQVNSPGSVISDDALRDLARTLHFSTVPIIAWVGPSGAKAHGGAAQLLAVVDKVAVAPGSDIGNTGDVVVPLAWWSPAFLKQKDKLYEHTLGSEAAASTGLGVDVKDALVLRRVLLQVPGFQVKAADGVPATQLVFSQIPTLSGWMHTVASPSVAYLLFVIGLALILFELFTAGVGIAGLVGAGCFILGSYGLWVLPTRPFAVALLLGAMVAYAVDVQVGVPRTWTGIASVLFVAGTFSLYDGLPVPWLAAIGGCIAMVVFMVTAMPAMTRTRFSTPSISREWLVGQVGSTVGELGPDGIVRVAGGQWRGNSASGDGIAAGAPVEVVAVDGVLVQVAPTSDGTS